MTKAKNVPLGKLFYMGGWLFIRANYDRYVCVSTNWPELHRGWLKPVGRSVFLREEEGELIDMSTPYDGGPR